MAWDAHRANRLRALAGCYALPGSCWAVLTTNFSPSKDATEAAAVPEGYEYKWVVLAPGEPPNLRGHRMAGLDNSDDSDVRKQIRADSSRGAHRAHRHYPNWKEVKTIRGDAWPVAGKGAQLQTPPASPEEFWALCMTCLIETLETLGLEAPSESVLFASHMTEKAFRDMQRSLRPGPASGMSQ